ncbi:MAG: family 43 glycosylhydrolase [Victivallales bacterium]|nr:family 43 glycosylhydrolase [Victivallales bacterium]
MDIYCNPLPLPEISRRVLKNLPTGDFREVSDPEVLYEDGVWYMYPSGGQAYVSRDCVHWEYHPIDIGTKLGYAPSVCRCGERILLTASLLGAGHKASIWAATAPLGPFVNLGTPVDRQGKPLEPFLDPDIFCDDDGRLYLYWGYATGHSGNIYGAEMDPANPVQAVSDVHTLIQFDGKNWWEHYGEHHEHCGYGWDEGVSMFKHNGEYYLQYASDGTVFRNYCCSCYRSKVSPLGPFTPPTRPMLHSPYGIVTGTGHGGMVKGPNGSVWQFYTCRIGRIHPFERRVGMDRVQFDEQGNPTVHVTSTPQSVSQGDVGLVPVSENKPATASSAQPFAEARMAVDACTHTCWAPAPEKVNPSLTVDCAESFAISALRIIWAEFGLDYDGGCTPEPMRFDVRFYDADHNEVPNTCLNFRDNAVERNIEFLTFEPVVARYVTVSFDQNNARLHHGITDFTLFAKPNCSTEKKG